MNEKILRYKEGYEEIEVPDDHKPCGYCKGKGRMSKYDEGWSSVMHSPDLAALHECLVCGGAGYVPDLNWCDDDVE